MEDRLFVYVSAAVIGSILYFPLLFLWWSVPFCEAFKEYNKKHKWLQPNWVSAWRTILFAIGVGIYFGMKGEIWYYISIHCIVIGAIGDAIDGLIARITKDITEWGKWLDPFLDKCSYLFALGLFTYYGYLSVYLYVVSAVIDMVFGQFAVRFILRKHEKSVAAIWPGKIKTILFFVLLFFCDLARSGLVGIGFLVFLQSVCLLFTILSAGLKLKPVYKP